MKLDKLYFKYSICCSKIKQRKEKRRVRRKLIKHIASVISISKDRELYSSYYPHLWSFEDVKQVCEDLGLPYTTEVERNIRYVYLDRD